MAVGPGNANLQNGGIAIWVTITAILMTFVCALSTMSWSAAGVVWLAAIGCWGFTAASNK